VELDQDEEPAVVVNVEPKIIPNEVRGIFESMEAHEERLKRREERKVRSEMVRDDFA
jgi:hypothetical protein